MPQLPTFLLTLSSGVLLVGSSEEDLYFYTHTLLLLINFPSCVWHVCRARALCALPIKVFCLTAASFCYFRLSFFEGFGVCGQGSDSAASPKFNLHFWSWAYHLPWKHFPGRIFFQAIVIWNPQIQSAHNLEDQCGHPGEVFHAFDALSLYKPCSINSRAHTWKFLQKHFFGGIFLGSYNHDRLIQIFTKLDETVKKSQLETSYKFDVSSTPGGCCSAPGLLRLVWFIVCGFSLWTTPNPNCLFKVYAHSYTEILMLPLLYSYSFCK